MRAVLLLICVTVLMAVLAGCARTAADVRTGDPPAEPPPAEPPPAKPPAAEPPSADGAPDSPPTPGPPADGDDGSAPPITAEELIAETVGALGRWADVAAAQADGFRSLGDGFTGYEHFVHPLWALNGEILNPERPESLVYRVTPEGHELVSAMYVLPPGWTMADVPDLGDPRAIWHTHDDLCFDVEGRVAGLLVDGTCHPGGVHVPTPPMLHVWIVDHPCGPFAGLDGHGDLCPDGHGHDHHH